MHIFSRMPKSWRLMPRPFGRLLPVVGNANAPNNLPLLALLLLGLATDQVAGGTNCSAADATRNCVDGMVVPIWKPYLDLTVGDRVLRGIIYFFAIAYLFLGVSIVADRFMSSIEVLLLLCKMN